MKQLLMGGSSAAMSAAAARYGQPDGADTWDSTLGDRDMLIAEDGTVSLLRVDLLAAPGAGKSLTFALMKNGVAQSLSAAITESATSAEDTSNSVAVSAGDRITLRCTPAGTPTTSLARWSMQYEATAANRAVWGGASDGALNTAATRYAPIGGSGQETWDATEANVSRLWAVACTVKSFYVFLTAAPGAGGDAYTFKIVVNGTPVEASAVTITDAATTGNATALSVAIAAGDTVSVECTPSVTPTNPAAKWGISYAPTRDGEFNSSSGRTATPTANSFQYICSQNAIVDATEDNRIMVPGAAAGAVAVRMLEMRVLLSAAPSAGDSRTVTLRKNGAGTALATTVANAATTGSSTGNIQIDNGDDFVYQFTEGGTPDASSVKMALRIGPPGGAPGGGGSGGGRGGGGGGRGNGNGQGGGNQTQRFATYGKKRLRY